jgi:hypothetical protein
MKSQNAKFGMLLLLAAAGCAQIIGLSDYEIDSGLGDAGEGGQAQGEGGGDTSGSSGKAGGGDAGAGNVGQGGDVGQAGEPPVQGGMPAVAGSGAGGEGGSGDVPVTVIPCDSVECCTSAGGVADDRQLLQNFDFETGHEWWTEYSLQFGDEGLIVSEDDTDTINAHAGAWFVWIGGELDEIASLTSPSVTVPADTGWLTVGGYRYLVYDSTDATLAPFDWVAVSLYQEGDWLEDIFLWDDYLYDNNSWFNFEVTFPADTYAGMSFEFAVEAVIDDLQEDPAGQTASNFFFDDLTFVASRCIEP